MKCLIVDDEPIAREIIKTYCAHFPELMLGALSSKSWSSGRCGRVIAGT